MAPALNFRTSDWNPRPAILDQGSGSERMDLYKENRSKIYLGGIPDPLIVESEGLQGSVHKNEQITISLLVGGGYPQDIPRTCLSEQSGKCPGLFICAE